MSVTVGVPFYKGTSLLGGSVLLMPTTSFANPLSSVNPSITVSSAVFMGEQRVPVMCRMCAQMCPALAVIK